MTNTTSMISSVLQRHTDPVILHNITYSNYITTEPSEIKKEIKQHFENWTKPNPINGNHWDDWQNEYLPQSNIDPQWYKELLYPISMQELQETIQESPLGKATESQLISNEIIKHLDKYTTEKLLNIFNACMILEKTPKI